jgi:uncharacterized protein YqgC (DUF456 family)
MICGGVCLAMFGSIAVLGIVGPLVVSLVLEYLAHRQRRSVRKA